MLRDFLNRFFGSTPTPPLDRLDGDAGFKVRGKPYRPYVGAIERVQLNDKQWHVADLFLIRIAPMRCHP